jgi:hypothetical protein
MNDYSKYKRGSEEIIDESTPKSRKDNLVDNIFAQ